jgi:hypothetical protein
VTCSGCGDQLGACSCRNEKRATGRCGWRYFRCADCGAHWREASRDHESPSISSCVSIWAPGIPACMGYDSPYKSEPVDWTTDRGGNLVEPQAGLWERLP